MSLLSQQQNEAWLAKRLVEHRGPDIFEGLTDTDSRREAMRAAIKSNGLELVIVGSKGGKPVCWKAAFERCYGEKL